MVLKTRRTCLAALLAGWLSVGLIASADEPESGQASGKEPGKKQQPTTEISGQPSVTPAPTGTPKRITPDFSPTEEISEDVAIPFPVDI
ncbi:hypothetical protein [Porticoccus sp.]|uniref:hypothetical protein n=1 Tax=Porticoccus sp. TaxID=2024853 RepID=UPI003F69C7CA